MVLRLRLEIRDGRSGGKSVSELNHRSRLSKSGEQKFFNVRSRDLNNNP
jgi:hypothetical protein